MLAVLKKEPLAQSPLPTPSPSPPFIGLPLPDPMSTVTTTTTITTTTVSSTRRIYSEAERRAHLALARQCAEQLRKLHLANGAQQSVMEDPRGEKYHVEIEKVEGDQKVKRRIAVIIPRAQKEHFRQHQLPSLTLIPPPHLESSPSRKPSLFPHSNLSSASPSRTRTTSSTQTPKRRLSLPSLRSLSLLPTNSTPPAPFRSRTVAPVPPTPQTSPSSNANTTTSRVPLSRNINLDTTSALLQRRKAALSLKSIPHEAVLPISPPSSDAYSAKVKILPVSNNNKKRKRSSSEQEIPGESESIRTKCARWIRHVRSSTGESAGAGEGQGGEGELSIGERMKRERELSLGERRRRR
ncbi:uncharacterized protein JCM6883_000324 [Sporobolomyces salmoneus]|uniref:uncharacterized protein n=1 Tax=Sporobolomyces salmoneus TaxID=183962 RepID=UPI00316D3BE6